MATNLDQAILDYFRAQQAAQINGGGSGSYIYTDPTTGKQTQAMPLYGQGRRVGEGMDAVYENGPMQGYRLGEYVPGQTIYDNNGRGYVDYNTQGQQIGAGTYEGLGDKTMDFIESALPYLAIATGAGMANAIGGLGAGAGVTGLPTGAEADLFYGGGMDGAATLGGGASVGGGAALPGMAGTGLQTMPYLELMNPALEVGSSLTPMALSGAGAAAGGAAGSALGSGAAGAGSSLIPGISDKALGLGATVLGGVLGSQETPGQTAERKMDPRLDGYVYGTNGLIPSAAGLLASQMPQAQQVGQQLNTMGTGLLGRGIAPNGFERFTKGRY